MALDIDVLLPIEQVRLSDAKNPFNTADRTTLRLSLHYERKDLAPLSMEVVHNEWTQQSEQPYSRAIAIPSGQSVPLDCGFVENPDRILIRNFTTSKTKAALDASHILILADDKPLIVVRPGDCAFFCMVDKTAFTIKAVGLPAKCEYAVFTR